MRSLYGRMKRRRHGLKKFVLLYVYTFMSFMLVRYTFINIKGMHLVCRNGLMHFTLFLMGNIVSEVDQIGHRPRSQNELWSSVEAPL